MLRGTEISDQGQAYVGEMVFLSKHPYLGSSVRYYRGVLKAVTGTHVSIENHADILLDHLTYDIMMSKN